MFPFCFDAHSGRASYYKTIGMQQIRLAEIRVNPTISFSGDLEAAGRAADTAMEILNNSLNVLKNGDGELLFSGLTAFAVKYICLSRVWCFCTTSLEFAARLCSLSCRFKQI